MLLLGSQANSIVPFILACKERNPLSTITGVLCHPKRSSFQNDNRIRSRWKQTERGAKDASSITKSKPWWELVWICRVRRWIHGLQVFTRPESWHSLEAKQSCKCWRLRCAYQIQVVEIFRSCQWTHPLMHTWHWWFQAVKLFSIFYHLEKMENDCVAMPLLCLTFSHVSGVFSYHWCSCQRRHPGSGPPARSHAPWKHRADARWGSCPPSHLGDVQKILSSVGFH